jgi:thymidylate kinase
MYFLLGNFITSEEVGRLLETQDVIVDKYIYSTIAYHSVLLDRELPIPEDILIPDHTFYLTASMEEIDKRLNSREKRNKYEVPDLLMKADHTYKRILPTDTSFIDTTTLGLSEMLNSIEEILNH